MRRRTVQAALLAAAFALLNGATAQGASIDQNFGLSSLEVNEFGGEVNTMTVSATPGTLVFQDTTTPPTTTAPQCVQVPPDRVECPSAGVTTLTILLGPENDTFVLDDTATTETSIIFTTVDGEDGDDVLHTGEGQQLVYGGNGDDVLDTGAAKDVIDAQFGDDVVRAGAGDDVIDGGAGDDRVDGGDGNDVVAGSSGTDVVLGGDGNDKLDVRGPAIEAELGADTLDGGAGDDLLSAGPQADTLEADDYSGGTGTDTVDYSARTSALAVTLDGAANDGAVGEGDNARPDVERVIGGSDSDTLVGSPGPDFLDGGAGDDMILGLDGDDTLEGGVNDGGSDSLDGGLGNDTLRGGPGDDSLSGGDGRDGLFGGGGADTLSGDPGDDNLAGGPGLDAVNGGDGDDVLRGGDAVLIGADGADELDGGAGTDTLLGGPGNDRLDGGAGPDLINGELGRDTVTYEARAVAITVTFDGAANDGEPGEGDNVAADVEAVIGSAVADTLSGDGRANALDGGSGDDVVEGAGGVDQLTGGTASDFIRARDGSRDDVDCGEGVDVAVLDTIDVAKNCEYVDRGARTRKPTVGRSTELNVSGRVLARIPDAERFVALRESLVLPLGTDFDARSGAVDIQTARRGGATQTATFSEGEFTVEQSNTGSRNPITEIRLRGGSFKGCTAGRRLAQKKDKVRAVWGKGRGRYRTRGRYSSGIVRGTHWLMEDRCDGTLTRVVSGVVEVRDFVRHKTVLVRAGHSYLARAPK